MGNHHFNANNAYRLFCVSNGVQGYEALLASDGADSEVRRAVLRLCGSRVFAIMPSNSLSRNTRDDGRGAAAGKELGWDRGPIPDRNSRAAIASS